MSRGEGLILARTAEVENGLSAEEGQSLKSDGLGHPRSLCLEWIIDMLRAGTCLRMQSCFFGIIIHETQATLEIASKVMSQGFKKMSMTRNPPGPSDTYTCAHKYICVHTHTYTCTNEGGTKGNKKKHRSTWRPKRQVSARPHEQVEKKAATWHFTTSQFVADYCHLQITSHSFEIWCLYLSAFLLLAVCFPLKSLLNIESSLCSYSQTFSLHDACNVSVTFMHYL